MANFRRFLYFLAAVAIAAGAYTVALGGDSLPETGDLSPNVESELRFYAVWWIGAGAFLIWLAPQVRLRTRELQVFCALLFLAGISRLLGVLDTDWPSTGQIVLMVIELTLPVTLILWQREAAR